MAKSAVPTARGLPAPLADVPAILRQSGADVVVSYLPVGSEEADKFYAQAAIDAGCAFVNALPVFIASDPVWAKKFEDAGLPIVGDDIKSQVGATITYRVMAKLFEDRGVRLERTMQLNVGGNMDFKNMLERERLESKKISRELPTPYTGNFTGAVWFGNDDFTSTRRVTGGSLPAMAWQRFMAYAHNGIELVAMPGVEADTLPRLAQPARPLVAAADAAAVQPRVLSRRTQRLLLDIGSDLRELTQSRDQAAVPDDGDTEYAAAQ